MQRELVGLLLVDGAIVHGRPHRLEELVLLVADELGEGRVELAELALEVEDGERLRDVVEAVARRGIGLGATSPSRLARSSPSAARRGDRAAIKGRRWCARRGR